MTDNDDDDDDDDGQNLIIITSISSTCRRKLLQLLTLANTYLYRDASCLCLFVHCCQSPADVFFDEPPHVTCFFLFALLFNCAFVQNNICFTICIHYPIHLG